MLLLAACGPHSDVADFIVISLPEPNLWLFAGLWESHGITKANQRYHTYKTTPCAFGDDLIGRLVVKYQRVGRNSYPYGESLAPRATVHEIKPERLAFTDFQGYKKVHLSRPQLEMMYRHEYPTWRSALSAVSGVYLLSDSATGKLYVGSAHGSGGIWGRWSHYAKTYHGGNSDPTPV